VARVGTQALLLVVCCLLIASCSFPGSVKPTVKVGLSAPFEGRHRDLGYEALYAVRLAVGERNEQGGVGDSYLVELVALNDFDEPEDAVLQARKMAVDKDILGVLGGWSPETARVAGAEYRKQGLAYLTPQAEEAATRHKMAEGSFVDDYEALSGGAPPGDTAIWAYEEAKRLLDVIDALIRAGDQPTRDGVVELLNADR
jgi:ABC-type branched-subunit amino acid transport system substrate-binding protein